MKGITTGALLLLTALPGAGALAGETGPSSSVFDLRPNLLEPIGDPADDWRVRTTLSGQPATIYGQISQGGLGYDDGAGREVYVPVDNSNASTRIGMLWQIYPVGGLDAVVRLELGFSPRASGAVSQLDGSGDGVSLDGFNIRKAEVIINTARMGTFMLGQGSMATDGIPEIDLSGTKVAAFSSVAQLAAAQYLRLGSGALSTVMLGDVFDNFDGDNVTGYNSDGSRKMRLFYETPGFGGFSAAVALGKELVDDVGETYADMALKYGARLGAARINAGLGFARKAAEEVVSGSLSASDPESGLNLTIAAGSHSDGGRYVYAKLGLVRRVFAFGDTALSVDLYSGRGLRLPGDRSWSAAIAVTQQLSRRNVEMFALIRGYDYDEPSVDYLRASALFTGFRLKF